MTRNSVDESKQYNNELFYKSLSGSMRSAKEILPLLFDCYKPASLLDVGCGLGYWLSVAQSLGVPDTFGVDGDYIDKKQLKIPLENFSTHDLKIPLQLNRKFDIVLSLEVAEHIPEERADLFVESLTNHADCILFSAAVPGQTGTYHINEQWQSYWKKKFGSAGYIGIDMIRPAIWENKNVEFWYKQNCFLYVNNNTRINSKIEELKKEAIVFPVDIVHPELLSMRIKEMESWQYSVRTVPTHLLNIAKKLKKGNSK